MEFPLSTGDVARHLNIPEPRLNDLIRRAKIEPLPPVVAGRRLWSEVHVEAARLAVRVLAREGQDSGGER